LAWFRSYLSGFPGVKSGSFSDPGQHVRPFIYFWGFDAVRLYSARSAVSTARSVVSLATWRKLLTGTIDVKSPGQRAA
jgi:hypothetical protein